MYRKRKRERERGDGIDCVIRLVGEGGRKGGVEPKPLHGETGREAPR